MEFLSTSVPSLRVASLPSTALEQNHHLPRPPTTTKIIPQSHLSNKPNSSFSLPTKPTPPSFTRKIPHLSSLSPSPISSLKPTKHFHLTASSGYAAALLDISRCNNDVEAVERDVRRFSGLLCNGVFKGLLEDSTVGMERKWEVLKEVGLHRHVVVLLKMMVEKGKVGLVWEVLEEFKRMCDEVRGTREVLVSSAKKMGEGELLGIAKKVQKISGAMKVKVRHVVDESLPISGFVL
ncbi:hypothetical protein AAC387_Pa06g0570 [Persea americana]